MPTATKLVPMPETTRRAFTKVFAREARELYMRYTGDASLNATLMKSISETIVETSQGIRTGTQAHPFDMQSVSDLKMANIHHARCLRTKAAATVGLGFQTEKQRKALEAGDVAAAKFRFEESKPDKELNKRCTISWRHTYKAMTEDYWELGGGLLEIKRDNPKRRNSEIVGIHFLPAPEAKVHVENVNGEWHWRILGKDDRRERRFAQFGDLQAFLTRMGKDVDPKTVSEVIYFPQPTNICRWYGIPVWLAAVAAIELVQCMTQKEFDFFLNRGVPEFLLFIIGAKLEPKQWLQIENSLKANIGMGNSHKSGAMNLTGVDAQQVKVQLEKLAMEQKTGDTFSTMGDALALNIVSAHGVPPLLAGIQTPGKIGASNELPNALMAFQLLEISEAQLMFQQVLGQTLGNPRLNGGLPLRMKDFVHNQITDAMDLNMMSTIGGMRQTLPEAKAQGRNLKAGMKD